MQSMPDLVAVLTQHPELVVVLAVVMRVARAYQTDLTWPEYRAIHRTKRGVLPILDAMTSGRYPLVNEKRGRDDPEYQVTLPASVTQTVRELRAGGASLHVLCAIKERPDTHGDPLTAAHVVWTVPDEGEQVECYLFRNADGGVDVYAHTEASVDRPLAHLAGEQTDGDAVGVLPDWYRGGS